MSIYKYNSNIKILTNFNRNSSISYFIYFLSISNQSPFLFLDFATRSISIANNIRITAGFAGISVGNIFARSRNANKIRSGATDRTHNRHAHFF